MVDIVKFLKEMDERSKANIAATKRRQQPLKDTEHGFKARGYVEPGQLKTYEQRYPGHRQAAEEAGVGGISKFFTPEHKKWIAANRAQMTWLPKDQPKYYGEDWRRLQDLRRGYTTGLKDGTTKTFAEAETPGLSVDEIVADPGKKVDITETTVEGEPTKTTKKWTEKVTDTAQDIWGIGKASAEGWYNILDRARIARQARNIQQTGGDASVAEGMYAADRARQRMPFNVARGLGGRTSQMPHNVARRPPPLWRMRDINRVSPSAIGARQLPGVRDTGPGRYSPMQTGGDARLAESMYGRRQQMPNNLYMRDEFGRIPTSQGFPKYDYGRSGMSGTTTPLPDPTRLRGSQISPRAEAMRDAYEADPRLEVQKRRDFDVAHQVNEGRWNQRNETYAEYLRRIRNPWPNFYGMRESQYYPNYGRGNY